MTFTFKLAKRIAHSRSALPRLIAAVIILAGCADGVGTEPTDRSIPDSANSTASVATVTVTPGSASGSIGQSAQFSAVAKSAGGRVLTGRTITWSTSNGAVVSVTNAGFATAIGGGSTTVNATIGGVTGRAAVTVVGPTITVASVTVTPGTASVAVGGTTRFIATVKDSSGATLTGQRVTWSSTNTAVVTVDSLGLSTAIGSGAAEIVAVAAGKSGRAAITVTATPASIVASVTVTPGTASGNVGDAAQFTADVKDASGASLTGQTVTWSSSNTAVVTVSTSGWATAVGGGSANVVATAGGKSGQAAITVAGTTPPSPAPVATVSLSSTNIALAVAGIQTIGVTLKDAAGIVLTGRTVTWTSSNALVASVSGLGLVTGLVAGTSTVTATSEGRSATATIAVSASQPPPPPPSGSGVWAHEPTSYPAISDNGFDLLTALGWGMAWNTAGNASIVSDATAPLSGSNVLEMKYPVGFAGGSGPANEWLPLASLHRMYAGFYWKASSPWQGHSSNVNKILFVFPSSGGDIYIAMYGPPGGPYDLRVLPQFPGLTSEWLRPNVTNVPVTVGTWHKIEWVMDYGSGGADGTIQWWMDGQMIGDYRNVQFPSGGLTEFKINPTWGGVGDNKAENDYFRYDHIHLSGN